MEKLPEDFKAKWVAALRSGGYKQGKSFLYCSIEDNYCCLGVAGAVAGLDKTTMAGESYFSTFKGEVPKGYPTFLTTGHRELIRFGNTYADDTLMQMNDSGKSFDEIADYIEANL
jgi:hypothetical protein